MFLSLLILTSHFIEGFTSDSFRSAIDANVGVLRSVVDKYRETMGFLREIGDSGDAKTKGYFGAIAHNSINCLEIYEDLFETILLPSGLDLVYHDSEEAVKMSDGVAKTCLTVSMVLRYLPMTALNQEIFPSIFARMSSLREDWKALSESAEARRETIRREATGLRDSEPNKNAALDAKAVIRLVSARFDSSFSLINQSTRAGADLSEATLMFVSFQRFLDHEISQLAQFDDLPVPAKISVIFNIGRVCQRMRVMIQAIPLDDWRSASRDTVEAVLTEWKRLGIKAQLVLRSLDETLVVEAGFDLRSILNSFFVIYRSTWSMVSESASNGSGCEMALEILGNSHSLIQGLNDFPDRFALLSHQGKLDTLEHLANTCKTIQHAVNSIPSREVDAEFRNLMELKTTQWKKLESQFRLFHNSLLRQLPADAKGVPLPTASITKEEQPLRGSSTIIPSTKEEKRSTALTKESKKKRPNQKRRKPNTIVEQVDEESNADFENGHCDQDLSSTSTEEPRTTTTTTTTEKPRTTTTTTTTEKPRTTTTTTEKPRTTTKSTEKPLTTTEESAISTRARTVSTTRRISKTTEGRNAPSGDSRENIRRGRNQPRAGASIPASEGSTGTPLLSSKDKNWNRSAVRNAPKNTPSVDGLESPAERVSSTTPTTLRVTKSSIEAPRTTTMTTSTAAQTTTTTTLIATTRTTTTNPTTTTELVTTASVVLTTQEVTSTTEEALESTRVITAETGTTIARPPIAPGVLYKPKRGSGRGQRTQKPPIPPAIESQSWTNYQSPQTLWQQQQQSQAVMYTAQTVIVPQTIVPISNQLRQLSDVLSQTMSQIHQLSQQALQLSIDPNTAVLANGNWHAMMETLHSVENLRSRLHAFAQYTESSLPPFLIQSPPGPFQEYNGPNF